MNRDLQGQYINLSTVGEEAQAFVPDPLPPVPPIELSSELREKFDQALLAHEKLEALFAEKGAGDDAGKRRLVEEHGDARFYFNKIETAKFFVANILPDVYGIAKSAESDDKSPMNVVF